MTAPRAVLALVLGGGAAAAHAGSLELGVHLGPTVPTYSQTFQYDPGPISVPISGLSVTQTGTFGLKADGGLSVGATVAWQFAGPFGLEARLDTADIDVTTRPGTYDVRVDLPSPLPDATTSLALGGGAADVERVRPLSLNLRLRTPGSVAFTVSGGLSYLPALRFSTTQTIGLGVTGLGLAGRIDVPTLTLRAEALPDEEGEGRWGANLGAGIRVALGSRVALTLEARAFRFQQQTLAWGRADDRPLSVLESALFAEVQSRLGPVEFSPTFYQATAGLTVAF